VNSVNSHNGAKIPTTRRAFLTTTAATTAALAVPHVHAAEPHDSDVVKVGMGGRGPGAVMQAL
jgi:hypothetical protein